jgi:phage gp36-like protein
MITQDDIKTRVSDETTLMELTDLDNTGQVDPLIVDRSISKSAGVVGEYVTIPDPLTDLIKEILTDIAVYFLFVWAAQRTRCEIPESIRTEYTDNMKLLVEMKRNEYTESSDSGVAIYEADEPIFQRGECPAKGVW